MKKKILIITTLILIIAAVGTWGYFKKPDPQIARELQEQFGDDFFNSFDNQNQTKPEDEANNTGSSITQTTLEKLNRTTEQQNLPAEKKQSEQAIIEKYAPSFDALEQTAFSRLDILLSSAVSEYKQQKAAGTLNTAALAKKYLQAGTTLENNVDSAFNSTLNDMKTELEQNDLPTTVIKEIQNQYDSAIAAKRSEILAKARR